MKMHGLGNDFVVIDSRGHGPVTTPELARAIGHRHFGVGFDQLAEICDSDEADIKLDFWNSDGSVAQACGNATRCVAQFILSEKNRNEISIKTLRGTLQAKKASNGMISVNMGAPQFDWQDIPLARAVDTEHLPLPGDPVAVGIGNPHCVLFVPDVGSVDVAARGAVLERNPLFPQATNVEFAQIRSRSDIRMRVWERGTGITLACGSGACAVAAAGHIRGLTDRLVNIEVDGGWLTLDWRDDGIWMTGPTTHVFTAMLSPEFLRSAGWP